VRRVCWNNATFKQRSGYSVNDEVVQVANYKVEVRRPWESTFTDVTTDVIAMGISYDLVMDAKCILEFECFNDEYTLATLTPGTEVRLWTPEYGIISDAPSFQGNIPIDWKPEENYVGINRIKMTVEGPLGQFDQEYVKRPLTGHKTTATLRMLNDMVRDPTRDDTRYHLASYITQDGTAPDIKAGKTILSAMKDVIKSGKLVDTTNTLNMRFPHIYPIFHENTVPTIKAEMEPDTTSASDFSLTDSDILAIEQMEVPESFSVIVSQFKDIIHTREWAQSLRHLGRREYKTDASDLAEAFSEGTLKILKSFEPTAALSVTLLRLNGIYLNKRVAVSSDSTGINDTFIVLGINCTVDPVPIYKIQLGFNFTQFEDYLKL